MNQPLWKVWLNPIVRRFATARLRWKAVLAWSVVVQALAGFGWLATYFHLHKGLGQSVQAAAMAAWVPILIIQGVLWIMKGTFSVAVGIAREGVEGLTDAQRLTPMDSWHKVIGYLVGLPILETLLVASLLPWTVASVVLGKAPVDVIFRVHLLLVTSAILHHALGLVAGTVIKQKIVAGTVSQLIVIVLHLVVPLLSTLGLGPLGHLGVESSIASELTPLLETSHKAVAVSVRFFHWEFAQSGYQWVIMTLLLAVLLIVLWRRWQRADAHLLSKPMALVFFAWILLMSLGEITPRLQQGNLFTMRALSMNARSTHVSKEDAQIGFSLAWVAGFGVMGLWSAMLLSSSLAPTLEQAWRASRAGGALSKTALPLTSDARSAVLWSAGLGCLLVGAWMYLLHQLFESPFLHMLVTPLDAMPLLLAAGVLIPLLTWTLLIEWRGIRLAGMAVFVLWIVGPMVAVIGILAGASPTAWPRWFVAASGFGLPFLSLFESVKIGLPLPFDTASVRLPWMVSLSVYAALAVVIAVRLRHAQRNPPA